MITKLRVKNFKSVKELELDCTRVNVLIGKPNAGKSNILETMGILSGLSYRNVRDFVRMETPGNLFYDEILQNPIEIDIEYQDDEGFNRTGEVRISFKDDLFYILDGSKQALKIDYDLLDVGGSPGTDYEFIRFYRYLHMDRFQSKRATYLEPPFGSNLFAVIMANEELKELISSMFLSLGLHLGMRTKDRSMEAVKHINNVFYNYPYITISDTFKRMIFYTAMLETSQNATLVFEEPESKSFPVYTKELAELIGLDDKNNQFFISTHNPYFLKSVVSKTPADEISVIVTYFEEYETRVRKLSTEGISHMLDIDPFFNLDRLLSL